MKKTYFVLIITICFVGFYCKEAQKKKKDEIKTGNMNGRVQSTQVTNYSTDPNFETPKRGDFLGKSYVIFDSLGHVLESTSYDENKVIYSKTTSRYNIYGDVIESITYSKWSNSYSKSIIMYDNKKKKNLEKDFNNDSLIFTTKYAFNGTGLLTNETRYDAKGDLNLIIKYKYDNSGNQIEEERSDRDGIMYKNVNKYDGKKYITEKKSLDAKGELQFAVRFKYDRNGNQIELANYDNENNLTLKNSSRYDNFGNVIELEKYESRNGNTKKQQFKYSGYDLKHNPTITILFSDDIPMAISESIIKYY